MRKVIFLLICVLFSCKTSEKRALQSISEPLRTARVSIHRGGGFESGWPENALESFKHYSELFPSAMLECDVRMTADSVMVLMHDDNLQRTSTGSGEISALNYRDLMNHKLKDNEGKLTPFSIPRLDSVLVWADGKVALTLDVKRNVPFDKVIGLVKKYESFGNCMITTYSLDEVQRVSQISGEIKVSCGMKSISDYEKIRSYGLTPLRIWAFLGTEVADSELIRFLKDHHIPMIQATIGNLDKEAIRNDGQIYDQVYNSGIEIIATDYPFEVIQSLNRLENNTVIPD